MLALLAASTIRVSVLLAAALVATRLLRRRPAALRRWLLATVICGALAVPLFGIALPAWHVTLPALVAAPAPASGARADASVAVETSFISGIQSNGNSAQPRTPSAGGRAWSAATVASWVWLVGALTCGLTLLAGIARLQFLARRSAAVADGRWLASLADIASADRRLGRVVLLQSQHPSMLATWGLLRPRILLPRGAQTWDAARVRVVLEHEAEHIRRNDWLMQLAAEALRTVWWFNPLAWIVAARLRLESEQACDDAVLERGVPAFDYAQHLVELARALARPRAWVPAPAMARASSLERRISAMLDPHLARRPLSRLARVSIVVVGLAATASIASVAAQSTFATVTGTIHDQLGGTIPNVTLTLTHVQSGAKHEVRSNDSGAFEFVGLPAGNYLVGIAAMGFKPVERTLQLAAGQTVRQDLTLELGTLQETIMVRDGPPASAPGRQWAPSMDGSSSCSAQPNSGGIKPPVKTHDKKPVYPVSMRDMEGLVELEAVIGVDGSVRTMRTVEATTPDFEHAAMDAVRDWRFTATLLNCVPVEVEMNVLTRFKPESVIPPPPPPPPPPPSPPPQGR